MNKKIYIISDHSEGNKIKELIKSSLNKYESYDIKEPFIDFPKENNRNKFFDEFCSILVANGSESNGILITTDGIEASIMCNKVKGIRAALTHDFYLAGMCKKHNNANLLIIASDLIGSEVILQMVDEYLKCSLDLENPNHSRRIKKIAELEQKKIEEK